MVNQPKTEVVLLKADKNNKSKILPFGREPAFYYRLYMRYAEAGVYDQAIFYLDKAIALSEGASEYRLELAKVYAAISRYEQSNDVYFKLLSENKEEGKCYFGLSQNLYFLNEIEHSVYYLNLYMEKHGNDLPFITEDDEDYIEIVTDDDDYYDGYKIVWPPERRDESELLQAARDYMKSSMFKKASELLLTVKKGNPDYIYARNNLALCCFFMGDYNLTRHYSEEVLALEPENIYALCNLAAMYGYVGKDELSTQYVQRILAVNTQELSDLFKISTTFCELKLHGDAQEYLLRILKEKPYDINIMFLTAIAYYNNRQISRAEDMFFKILRLSPKEHAARHYLDYIDTVKKEGDMEKGYFQPLEYICQVPYGETLERIKRIKQLIAAPRAEISQNMPGLLNELLRLCEWGFTVTDADFQKSVVKGLMTKYKSAAAIAFLREQLLSVPLANSVKRYIIELFITSRVPVPYLLNADYVVKKLMPLLDAPERQYRRYYTAYAHAFAYASISRADGTEKDLFMAYKTVLTAAKLTGARCKNQAAIAAVIIYRSKQVKSVKLQKSICAMLKTGHKDFIDCLSELGLN